MSRDSVLLLLPSRGNRNTFSGASHCVWFGSRIDKGWVHTTRYFLFCERILPSFFFFQTKSSYSWTMTQAEKFPKHLKPENLCLESLKFVASRWRDWKKGQSSGRRWEDEGWWKPEVWITSDFRLPSDSVPGRRTGSSSPLRRCQRSLGGKSWWSSLFRGQQHSMKECLRLDAH